MNRPLCKSEHRYVLVILIIPPMLLSNFKELIDQVSSIFAFGWLLLVIVASIGRIETAYVILTVHLIAMQHNDHAFLNRLLILVQKEKKIDFVVCYWVTYCGSVFVFCLQLLSFIFNLSYYSNHVYLALWILLQNSIDSSNLFRIYLKTHVLFLYELRISVEYYLQFPLF